MFERKSSRKILLNRPFYHHLNRLHACYDKNASTHRQFPTVAKLALMSASSVGGKFE